MNLDPYPAPASMAVICVMHDSAPLLTEFIEAVRSGTLKQTVRLVLVDSGSQDDSVVVACRAAPEADVARLDGNRGFAAGINAGIAHVRATGGSRAFVVVNPDMRPDPGSLDVLAEALELPGIGIACGQLRDQFGTRQDSLRNAPTVGAAWAEAILGGPRAERLGLQVEVVRDERHYASAGPVGWATGGLLALTETCSREVGPWAEDLFLYEEEVDFCARAAAVGFNTWYTPGSTAVRVVGQDDAAPWRQALMRRNRVRVTGQKSRAQAALVAAALVAGDLARAVLGRAEARAGVWAVLTRATPAEIMSRYAPPSTVSVTRPGGVRSTTQVFQSSWGEPLR